MLNTVANRKRSNFMGVWLSDNGARSVTVRAEDEKVSKSEMLRRMIAYAVWKMPRGWHP